MLSDEVLADVVDKIYEAALDADLWSATLDLLSRTFDLNGATLLFTDAAGGLSPVFAGVGVDPTHVDLYDRYYFAVDPQVEASRNLEVGTLVSSDLLFPDTTWQRTEFYNDFLRLSDVFYIAGCSLMQQDGFYAALGMHRSRGAGPLDTETTRFFLACRPHLSRAMGIHRRLAGARWKADRLEQTLDRLRLGVVLLSDRSRVLEMNDEARRILALGDGLRCEREELFAATVEESARLRQFLTACRSPHSSRTRGVLRLSRPSGRRPYEILAARLRSGSSPRRAAVALFLTDPERPDEWQLQRLQELYGLTSSEAEVCGLLLRGLDAGRISQLRDVASETTKSQLKSILSKTGTGRQAELVAKLLRSPVGSVRDEPDSGASP